MQLNDHTSHFIIAVLHPSKMLKWNAFFNEIFYTTDDAIIMAYTNEFSKFSCIHIHTGIEEIRYDFKLWVIKAKNHIDSICKIDASINNLIEFRHSIFLFAISRTAISKLIVVFIRDISSNI